MALGKYKQKTPCGVWSHAMDMSKIDFIFYRLLRENYFEFQKSKNIAG